MFYIINVALTHVQTETVETNYHFPLCFCFLVQWGHFIPLTQSGGFIHSDLDASSLNCFTRVGHPGLPLQSQRDGIIARPIQFSLRQMSTIDQMNHTLKELAFPCSQNGQLRIQVQK